MILDEFFDRIFIVNLDRRTDRWNDIKSRLQKVGIYNFERFSAIEPDLNQYPQEYYNKLKLAGADREKYKVATLGCKLSHYNIIKIAKERKYKQILILEDDADFHSDIDIIFRKHIELLKQIAQWDMIYFGGNHVKKPTPVIDKGDIGIYRVWETHTTHAYALFERIFDYILEYSLTSGKEIDRFYSEDVQPSKLFNCYCLKPHLIWQSAGFSDILQQNRHYKFLMSFENNR